MQYDEFVSTWRKGGLFVDVDSSLALRVLGTKRIPQRYRAAHQFWSWVFALSIPASFFVMYRYGWGTGLLMLAVVPGMVYKGTRKSAMQFMIDHSLENADFYKFAVDNGVLCLRPKP
jgi:hypothetical protein